MLTVRRDQGPIAQLQCDLRIAVVHWRRRRRTHQRAVARYRIHDRVLSAVVVHPTGGPRVRASQNPAERGGRG